MSLDRTENQKKKKTDALEKQQQSSIGVARLLPFGRFVFSSVFLPQITAAICVLGRKRRHVRRKVLKPRLIRINNLE